MAYIRTPYDHQIRNGRQCKSSPRCIVVALSIFFIVFNWIVYFIFRTQTDANLQYTKDTNNDKDGNLNTQGSHKQTANWFDTATERQRGYRGSPDWHGQWYRWRALNPSKLDQSFKDSTKYDIVYTWVNGSDPLFKDMRAESQRRSPIFEKALLENPKGIESTTVRRYRDMDELRYSLRSTIDYASKLFRYIHIVTTEVGANRPQSPDWLRKDPNSPIRIVGHRAIFENPNHLPTYNSLAIESQFFNIPDLTDIFLYMNDDIFLGMELLPFDIWTPLYGYVLHMEASLLVPPTIRPFEPNDISVGEWHSLQYSNYLLSKRFGPRHRAYIAHVIHVLSVSMIKEIKSLWPDDIEMTSSHNFRGEGEGKDIHISFFMAHYIMEKLRETQLESFWKYRLDANQDGILSWEERTRLIDIVKVWNVNQNLEYRARAHNQRPTIIHGYRETLWRIGIRSTPTTVYRQAGLDGYPFLLKNGDTSKPVPLVDYKGQDGKDVRAQVPYMSYEKPSDRRCKLDIDFCFGQDFVNSKLANISYEQSKSVFDRLAFREFHCGDCLLEILMQHPNSGGMGAWMPTDEKSEAFANVVKKVERYNYVLGTSDYSFIALQGPEGSKKDLDGLLSAWDHKAFFCVNDDFPDTPEVQDEIMGLFKEFLDTRFAVPSAYESD
ncbi:hypothetical protein FBU30_001697 [Linnemannia zychae]|nr:hypothetical protein FBU30_001697 [Linnemannia zychae]